MTTRLVIENPSGNFSLRTYRVAMTRLQVGLGLSVQAEVKDQLRLILRLDSLHAGEQRVRSRSIYLSVLAIVLAFLFAGYSGNRSRELP
jgi:hypothetical protein